MKLTNQDKGRPVSNQPDQMNDRFNPNLNQRLFKNAANVEEMQSRRFRRKQETGYVGTGFWNWNYPYMIGSVGAGTLTQTQSEESNETPQQESQENESTETANTSTGMGPSTASAAGAAGGLPA